MHLLLLLLTLSVVLSSAHASEQLLAPMKRGGTKPFSYTQEICRTKVAFTSARSTPTQTVAITVTLKLPIFVPSTKTTTITPAPITSTVIDRTTITTTSTDMIVTDTFTTTITPTTTTTTTSTSTETDIVSTSTVISVTATATTLTINPGPSFTPLATQLDNYNNNRQRRSFVAKSKEVSGGHVTSRRRHKRKGACDAKFPQSVKCEEVVEVIIHTTVNVPAWKTKTITAPTAATQTTTFTSTTVTTATVAPPHVSNTVTTTAASKITDTMTTSTVTTTTSTTTQTQIQTIVPPPLATVYSACQANNIVNSLGDSGIENVSDDDDVYTSSTATSAVDCCNQCQAAALLLPTACGAFSYDNRFDQNACVLLTELQFQLTGFAEDDGVTAGSGPQVYNKESKDERDRMRKCIQDCIAEGAEKGWGEYRTHNEFMDQVAGTYSYNDNALAGLNNTHKDALDPNGILAPGKSGGQNDIEIGDDERSIDD